MCRPCGPPPPLDLPGPLVSVAEGGGAAVLLTGSRARVQEAAAGVSRAPSPAGVLTGGLGAGKHGHLSLCCTRAGVTVCDVLICFLAEYIL